MKTSNRQTATFSWHIRNDDEALTLELCGELDLAAVIAAKEGLLADAQDAAVVVVDLSALSFIDSTGLRLLVELKAAAEMRHARFVLGPTSKPVDRVLEIAGIRSHFQASQGRSADASAT